MKTKISKSVDSLLVRVKLYKRATQAAVGAAVAVVASSASSAYATVITLTPADVDFVAIASTIMGWVVVAAMAALTLFGAVQGLKIGIRTFRSIANQATA